MKATSFLSVVFLTCCLFSCSGSSSSSTPETPREPGQSADKAPATHARSVLNCPPDTRVQHKEVAGTHVQYCVGEDAHRRQWRHGPFERLSAEGWVMERGIYAKGKKNGLWRRWSKKNVPAQQGTYNQGKQDGLWHFFHDSGRVSEELRYDRGRVISHHYYDETGKDITKQVQGRQTLEPTPSNRPQPRTPPSKAASDTIPEISL